MEVQKIPLSLVYPSPMNPRKTFDEVELAELADNIEKQGLLQPITVRPVKPPTNEFNDRPDKYEIVCGERRYRACLILQEKWQDINAVAPDNRFDSILAIVREMNDDEAFEAMITENLQRKDVDPMEEAFAFGKLIDKGYTAEEIGARFGKSLRFVQDRVKLNSLIPECVVAVKDGKMPLVAAQIICKLEPEAQKDYHKRYVDHWQGFTKQTAQNYVDNLFMNIERSIWYENDKPDFEGGCGRKCSECQFNTSNHGCLFYEMKTDGAGKCTDRSSFNEKSLAFFTFVLEHNLDKLVKNGMPLERGKKVVAIKRETYDAKHVEEMKDKLITWLAEHDVQVVNPEEVFKYRCYYEPNDERTIQMLDEGKVYPVVTLMNYDRATIEERCWYLKDENAVTEEGSMKPIEVQRKATELANLKRGLESSLHIECAKTMSAKSVPTSEPLTEVEKKAFCLLVMEDSFRLKNAVGVFEHAKREELYNAYSPDMFEQAVRAFLQDRISVGNIPSLHTAAPMLDEIGAIWCKEQYEDTKEKVIAKHDKKVAKLVKGLADLGYDENGNKIEDTKDEKSVVKLPKSSKPLEEEFKAMKEKHPEAIILLRVGDFYEAFDKDAEDISEILGITLTRRKDCVLSGFPHHALESYLPRIIRSGRRVAVCEELESPKKK